MTAKDIMFTIISEVTGKSVDEIQRTFRPANMPAMEEELTDEEAIWVFDELRKDYARPEKWAVIDGQSAELEMKLKMMKEQVAPDNIARRLSRLATLNEDLRGLVNAIDKAANK